MMKLKCISESEKNLTRGKVYERLDNYKETALVKVKNNAGYNCYYPASQFEKLTKKVKYLGNTSYMLKEGIYTVKEETEREYLLLDPSPHVTQDFRYLKKYFEEVEEIENMTNLMPAIVAGNIIEIKDETRGLVIKTPNSKQYVYWFYKSKQLGTFVTVNEKGSPIPKREDIVKIYKGITNERPYAAMGNHIYAQQELVWEHKLPIVKLTVKEIADKFGIKEEQLEIEDYE